MGRPDVDGDSPESVHRGYGPGGLEGNPNPERDPIWSVGWDHKSLILMLLDGGAWQAYRLPKASHAYDGAHGWNTEWPRIRDIASGISS